VLWIQCMSTWNVHAWLQWVPPPYGGSTSERYNLTQTYFWFTTKIWFGVNFALREKLQTHVNFVLFCKVHAWLHSGFRPPYGGTSGRYNLNQTYFWFKLKFGLNQNRFVLGHIFRKSPRRGSKTHCSHACTLHDKTKFTWDCSCSRKAKFIPNQILVITQK